MNETKSERIPQTDAELDAVLAGMAEVVPPMPADFREKWMKAVRADAAGQAASAEEEKTEKNPAVLRQWTRILSIAAALVFLIGGTMLYRASGKKLSDTIPAENRKTAEPASALQAPAEDAEETLPETEEAEEAVWEAEYDFADEAAEEAAEADAAPLLVSNAVMDAYAAGAAYEAAAPGEAREAGRKAEAPAEDFEAEEAAPEASAAGISEAAESAEQVPAEKAETEAGDETAQEPENAEKETDSQGGFLREAGTFLTDMLDFLRLALPYLAVLAVPAAAALVIRYRKRK